MERLSEHDSRFARRARAVRRHRSLSQQQLADMSGVPRHAIAALETGARGVSLGEAVELCRALGVQITEMIDPAALVLAVSLEVRVD